MYGKAKRNPVRSSTEELQQYYSITQQLYAIYISLASHWESIAIAIATYVVPGECLF